MPLKRLGVLAAGDEMGDELLARFLTAMAIDELELCWSHSIRSSGETSCTSRRISPMPMRSGNASFGAGVEGTFLLELLGKADSCDCVASVSAVAADCSPATSWFSFSSCCNRLIEGCFANPSSLGCPANWKTESLFLVAVETGIGGFSRSGRD